jgi:hypothetical protein
MGTRLASFVTTTEEGDMRRARVVTAFAFAALGVSGLSPANATVLNYSVDVFPGTFSPVGGPITNLHGTFTLVFDDSVDVAGSLSSATITDSLDASIDASDFGPLGFRYIVATDILGIGTCDLSGCAAVPGTDNFVLNISSATSSPDFISAFYSFQGENYEYTTSTGFEGSISFEEVRTPIPEPAPWSLFIVAFGGVWLAMRGVRTIRREPAWCSAMGKARRT